MALATASDFPAAAGLGDVCGLNISANVFFSGEADALAAGEAAVGGVAMAVFFRAPLAAGSVTGCVVVVAAETVAVAEGAGVALAFFLDFFAGEADASAAGDSLAPGEASVAAFLRDFFAGEADASGEAAGEALAAGVGD